MFTHLRTVARKLLRLVTTVAQTAVQLVTHAVTRFVESPAAALGFVGAFTGALFLFSR